MCYSFPVCNQIYFNRLYTYNTLECRLSELFLPCKYLLHYYQLQPLLTAKSTRAESSTRKCMIDAHCKLGRGELLAVFIYLHSYLIAFFKLQNVLTLQITAKLFLISYSFSRVLSCLLSVCVFCTIML